MDKKTKLYHCEIGFPKGIETQFKKGVYSYSERFFTEHGKNALKDDRYGKIILPITINFNNLEPFEIMVENGEITKFCYRVPYQHDNNYDVSIVFFKDNTVKTVWLNKNTDQHKTLIHSNYDKP